MYPLKIDVSPIKKWGYSIAILVYQRVFFGWPLVQVPGIASGGQIAFAAVGLRKAGLVQWGFQR